MKTFFLDDSRQRIDKARSEIAGHFVAALDAATAIQHLQETETVYDLICLDHDLVGVYCPSDAQSGCAVAEAIASLPQEKLPKKVVVHSYNYDAVKTPPLGGVGNILEALTPLDWYNIPVVAAPFDSAEFWQEVAR